MKKLSLILGLSILAFSLFPGFSTKAQSCNPDALVPVKYGQRGDAVRNAQLCLMEAGYDIPAGATGYYGPQTKAAVRAFYADWYGYRDGNNLGPRGVQELRNMLAGAPSKEEVSQSSQQDQTAAIVAAVLAALQQMGVLPSTSTQQQQAGAEEGFLRAEKDPTVAAPVLREGESGRVAGLRFRADNGAVKVQSIFLRWGGSVAPYRAISALKVVDSSGNVLYQTQVGPSTFLQDSSLNYYLPITGLNVQVPKNGYTSVFVEVTVVGTLPSSVSSGQFYVNQNDVRGVDGAGVNRFAPDSQLTWNFSLQPSLAGNARFVLSLNPNTPKQGYVFGDPVDGKAYRVKVLSFDLQAKNDNLRVTRVSGMVTNTSTVNAVYLAQGSNVMDVRTPSATGTFVFDITPSNFVVNRDQSVTFDVLVDFTAGNAPSVATFTVSVATTSGVNSLGDNIQTTSTTVTSELMRAVRLGPQFAAVEKTISVTRDQNNNTTTVQSVVFRVNVKAVGGTLYVPISNTATITLETASGTTLTVNVSPTTVRVGSTVVSPSGTYYVVPEGSTYEFEFRTSGQTFAGAQAVRARLSSFAFDNDNDTSIPVMDTASFLNDLPEFWTNWSN